MGERIAGSAERSGTSDPDDACVGETILDRLESLGVTVQAGHAAANVGEADVVVYSSAVRPDNP